MPQKGDDWTASEESTLQNHWDTHTAQEIADMLPGRTLDAVYSKHQRMKESSSTAIQTAPDPVNSDDQDEDVKRITVNKEDIKEGYEFNRRPESAKNRRRAVIEIRGNQASLHYDEEGHWYPDGAGPEFTLEPRDFFEPWKYAPYPTVAWVRESMDDDYPDLERGTEAYREKEEEMREGARVIFWEQADWKQEIELNPNQKELTGFDRVIVKYR